MVFVLEPNEIQIEDNRSSLQMIRIAIPTSQTMRQSQGVFPNLKALVPSMYVHFRTGLAFLAQRTWHLRQSGKDRGRTAVKASWSAWIPRRDPMTQKSAHYPLFDFPCLKRRGRKKMFIGTEEFSDLVLFVLLVLIS